MVWDSLQSPLYRAVENFNSAAQPCEPSVGKLTQESCEQKHEHIAPKPCHPSCEQQESEPCDHKPRIAERPQNNDRFGNPLQALFSDKDMLLVAALIIILIHEKADMKIIIALGLILLM